VAARPRRGYGLLLARQTRVQSILAENDGKTTEDLGARETQVTNETVEGRYVVLKSGFASSIATVVDLETSDGVKIRSFPESAQMCHVDFPGDNGTSHRENCG